MLIPHACSLARELTNAARRISVGGGGCFEVVKSGHHKIILVSSPPDLLLPVASYRRLEYS